MSLPGQLSRPPVDPLTTGAVVVALLAVSSSGPLIAFAAAPALAVAFWRNALAATALGPFALIHRRSELRGLTWGAGQRQGWYCVLSGVALAVHFGTWMPSVQLTTVATATALVATQPVWQGLIAVGQGRRLSLITWVGIVVAVGGAGWATGADFGVSGQAVIGDLLAVAGAAAVAIYTALGERARSSLSTVTYTTICYSVCGLLLLAVCLAGGIPLRGFETTTWLAILALVGGAQLLGHSMLNYALHRLPATTISVLILLEVPGAALIAWIWLGQELRVAALPGLVSLIIGVAIVILGGNRAGRQRGPAPVPPDAGPLPADGRAAPTARSLTARLWTAGSGSATCARGRRGRPR